MARVGVLWELQILGHWRTPAVGRTGRRTPRWTWACSGGQPCRSCTSPLQGARFAASGSQNETHRGRHFRCIWPVRLMPVWVVWLGVSCDGSLQPRKLPCKAVNQASNSPSVGNGPTHSAGSGGAAPNVQKPFPVGPWREVVKQNIFVTEKKSNNYLTIEYFFLV